MNFVVDASVALSWCFHDEMTPVTQKLLKDLSSNVALVPAWWYLEITNVLALAERKRRISTEDIDDFVAVLGSLQIEVDNESPPRAFSHLLPLCRAHSLTSYDAMYLDLAQRRHAAPWRRSTNRFVRQRRSWASNCSASEADPHEGESVKA